MFLIFSWTQVWHSFLIVFYVSLLNLEIFNNGLILWNVTWSWGLCNYKKIWNYMNQPPSSAHDVHKFSELAFPSISSCPFLVSVSSSCSHFLLTNPQKPPVPPCNEDILPVGRLMVDRERYLTNPKPPDSSSNFAQYLCFFHWKEIPFTVWMSQVNPIPKGNGIWDGEQIAPRWCWTGQETLEEKKKLARSNTIEDTAVIFAVSRVFIIDFPLWHNGWAIMKSLSFLFLCVVRWWGHGLKVARVTDCMVLTERGTGLKT